MDVETFELADDGRVPNNPKSCPPEMVHHLREDISVFYGFTNPI